MAAVLLMLNPFAGTAEAASARVITVGTKESVSISESGKVVFFSFTPEESGNYLLAASPEDADLFGFLYVETLEENELPVDYLLGNLFTDPCAFEAGKTVIIGVRYLNGKTGTFSMRIEAFEEAVPGDLNEDGTVDTQDAIYLLFHAFFPELYPVPAGMAVDFTKDGSVTVEDAIYLLFHSFFPDLYPIS